MSTGDTFTGTLTIEDELIVKSGDPDVTLESTADTGVINIFFNDETPTTVSQIRAVAGTSYGSNGRLYFDATERFEFRDGIGGTMVVQINDPTAMLVVDQYSSTGAIPVLYLDQADLDQPMIQFETTIGTGNAIEAVGGKSLTTTHFIMVELPGGLTRYIPAGTIA
jgi:hypothetical protein